MQNISHLLTQWDSLSRQLDSALQALKDLKATNKYLISQPIPFIQRYFIKSQPTKRGGDKITTEFGDYNREIWERVILHGHLSLEIDGRLAFPNHLRNCKEQYQQRKAPIRHIINDNFQEQIELRLLQESLRDSKSYKEFKVKKEQYRILEMKLQIKRTENVQKISNEVQLYQGLEMPESHSIISSFEI